MSVLFLIAAGMLQAPAAISQPQIVVRGEGRVRLKPNLVALDYNVHGEGKTSDEAVKALNAIVRRVENALVGIDPQMAPLSQGFRVVIIRGEGCGGKERYDEQLHLTVGKCAIAGYVAEQEFTARTARVDDIGTMISAVSRAGAIRPRFDDFALQDRAAGRAQAIASATQDARTKAEAVAAANGATLGPVLDIELDNARDGEAITVTGSRMFRYQEEAEPPVPVTVRPEPVEVRASVKVTYRLNK